MKGLIQKLSNLSRLWFSHNSSQNSNQELTVWLVPTRYQSGKVDPILIDSPRFELGRHPSCSCCLNYLPISGKHCVIYKIDDKVFIEDLGSTNGTHLNYRKISPFQKRRLHNGDIVELEAIRFTVVLGGTASDATDLLTSKWHQEGVQPA